MVGKEDDPFLLGFGNFSGAMFVKLWEGDSNILYVLSVFLLAVCEIFVNTVAGKIGD